MARKLFCILLTLMLFTSVSAQTIKDSGYRAVAYIKSDGTIQDSSYRTIGYIKTDGRVQDASYRTVGYLKDDGRVQDSSYHIVGYAKGIPLRWAAFYFFFRQ